MKQKQYINAGSAPQPPNLGGLSWLKWPLEHYPITILLVVILLGIGIFGMQEMPKDEFPAFTIRQGIVVAVYPGATSEEVEEQVAKPLERYLFTFKEVRRDRTTTTSQNGMCLVHVYLNDDVNNKDEVWSKVKHGLNLFKQQLPAGVLALVANDDFGNTSALLIASRALSAATVSCTTTATGWATACAASPQWPMCEATASCRSRFRST